MKKNDSYAFEEINGVQIHPLAALLPMMSEEQLQELTLDIKRNGLQEDIILFEGKILDGRHRYKACVAALVEPRFKEFDGKNAVDFIISQNVHRRHLNPSQKAFLAMRVANLPRGANQHASNEACSQSRAAQIFGVSRSSVQRAEKIQTYGTPELNEMITEGRLSVACGVKIATLPRDQQIELMKLDSEKEILKAMKKQNKHEKGCSCKDCLKKKQQPTITLHLPPKDLAALRGFMRKCKFNNLEDFIHMLLVSACNKKPPQKETPQRFKGIKV